MKEVTKRSFIKKARDAGFCIRDMKDAVSAYKIDGGKFAEIFAKPSKESDKCLNHFEAYSSLLYAGSNTLIYQGQLVTTTQLDQFFASH